MGRVHEAQRHPTKFDNKGKLPDTKKLSGIRSKEVSGGGFGQLRFDDTPGQISTQLQSSHGASQLNLGKLSHPKDKAKVKTAEKVLNCVRTNGEHCVRGKVCW